MLNFFMTSEVSNAVAWFQPILDFLFEKTWEIAFVLLAMFLTWITLQLLRKGIYKAIRVDAHMDMQQLSRKQRYLMTFVKVFLNIIQYLFWFIIFIQILSVLGIKTDSFITILGATGLTIGIIIRDIFVDMMNGFLILTEDQFRVGDYITVNNYSGYVQEIGIRTTKILGSSGDILVLANRNITSVVTYPENKWNFTIDVEIPIEFLDEFEQIIDPLLLKLSQNEVEITSLKYLGVNELRYRHAVCRINAYSSFNEQWRIRRLVLNALKPYLFELTKE